MSVTPSGIVKLFKPEHSLKRLLPIFVIFLGIVISVKLLQDQKAPSSMLVTFSEIVIFLKFSQPLNAHLPMVLTLYGITTVSKLETQKNA